MSQLTPSSGTQAAAFEMLMNAIGSSLISVIQQLVNSDPSLVLLRGWHGMTPLHRACLIGDYNIVLLLVQANADVNALTNFHETPLHYASKRGMPTVVHLLIQCGAKIELRDQKGRNALHHAAENGAVDVVRYFQDAFNLDLQTLDNNYQSALHLACAHGQMELFIFLINTGSSDLRQPDIQGNLPIHITAKNGYGHMTWRMLCILGVSVLHQTNKAGMTPVDLASQSDSEGHRELVPVLKHYAKQPDTTPVTGPVWGWYARLASPFSLYLLLIIISQHIGSHQYLIFAAGLGVAAFISKNLSHRVHNISRWPEPFYAGFFYGGVLHTTICFFWLMLPYAYTRMWVLLLCFTTIPGLHYVFYRLMTSEPGFLTTPAKDTVTGKQLTMVDVCQVRNPPYRFCYACNQIVAIETKHCKLCERCFVRMDHHCLFLLRCVAMKNHSLFLWLLILGAANMALYCVAFVLYTQILYGHLEWLEIFSIMIDREGWPVTLLFLNGCSFFWCTTVLHFQFECVAFGLTAYFNRPPAGYELKRLTRMEKFTNFCYFLLDRPLPHTTLVPESDSLGKANQINRLVNMALNDDINVV